MALKFVMLLAVVGLALAYPDGAPPETCGDMIPQHHTPPQKGQAPYLLNTSRRQIRSGDEVKLTITGKGPSDKIRGFLIQARHGDEPIGHFQVAANDKFVQAIDCGSGKSNAVTHKEHPESDDKKSLELTWVSPKDFHDKVTFRCTILLNGGVFWVGVQSDQVTVR